jgi:hypothetical protein
MVLSIKNLYGAGHMKLKMTPERVGLAQVVSMAILPGGDSYFHLKVFSLSSLPLHSEDV